MTREVRIALIGLGNVGRSFLRILQEKEKRLADEFGLAFKLVCIADSSGVAVNPVGYDIGATLSAKESGVPVRRMHGYWLDMEPGDVFAADFDCDLMLDASPVNLITGQPGLGAARMALRQGVNVVLANKAPLVLAFQELTRLSKQNRSGLAYSATVCGALPVVNIGTRDLVAADYRILRGIFNSTSNYILDAMAEGGSYDEALRDAQDHGLAEADPSLDVEGWDTANKLVIVANSFLGMQAKLDDVDVQGITDITQADFEAAKQAGKVIKLVASAEKRDEGYTLSVQPMQLPADDFLAQCSGFEMGVEMETDLYGHMYYKDMEGTPIPTAAAMLRDAIHLSL